MNRVYCCLWLFLISFFLFSQNKEFHFWNSLELEYKTVNDVKLLLEIGERSESGLFQNVKYFSDFSIYKKHNKLLGYALGYRYVININNTVNNRLYSDVYYKYKLYDNIRFISRSRVQIQKNSLDFFTNKIRQKIKLNFNIQKTNTSLFTSVEFFYVLQEKFEKIRYVIGLKQSIVKNTDLALGYMMEKGVGEDTDNTLFALRVKLLYGF